MTLSRLLAGLALLIFMTGDVPAADPPEPAVLGEEDLMDALMDDFLFRKQSTFERRAWEIYDEELRWSQAASDYYRTHLAPRVGSVKPITRGCGPGYACFAVTSPCLLGIRVRHGRMPFLRYGMLVNWEPCAPGEHRLAFDPEAMIGLPAGQVDWSRAYACQPTSEQLRDVPVALRQEYARSSSFSLHGLHASCDAPELRVALEHTSEGSGVRVSYSYANGYLPLAFMAIVESPRLHPGWAERPVVEVVAVATSDTSQGAVRLGFDPSALARPGRRLVVMALDAADHMQAAWLSWKYVWHEPGSNQPGRPPSPSQRELLAELPAVCYESSARDDWAHVRSDIPGRLEELAAGPWPPPDEVSRWFASLPAGRVVGKVRIPGSFIRAHGLVAPAAAQGRHELRLFRMSALEDESARVELRVLGSVARTRGELRKRVERVHPDRRPAPVPEDLGLPDMAFGWYLDGTLRLFLARDNVVAEIEASPASAWRLARDLADIIARSPDAGASEDAPVIRLWPRALDAMRALPRECLAAGRRFHEAGIEARRVIHITAPADRALAPDEATHIRVEGMVTRHDIRTVSLGGEQVAVENGRFVAEVPFELEWPQASIEVWAPDASGAIPWERASTHSDKVVVRRQGRDRLRRRPR